MGKKTNWTLVEDQSLCRAWIRASESVVAHGGEQKAAAFWNLVHAIYHKELESATERPLNGLKIRWTRINRDVQQFALCFAHVAQLQAKSAAAAAAQAAQVQAQAQATANGQANEDAQHHPTEDAGTNANANANNANGSSTVAPLEVDSEPSPQLMEEAHLLYLADHPTKFAFENCWRLLRTCPKWIQLLRNANGTTFAISASTTSSSASTSASSAGSNASTSSTTANAAAVSAVAAAAAAAVANATAHGPQQQQPLISPSSSLLGEDMLQKEELLAATERSTTNGAFLVSPGVHGTAAEVAASSTSAEATMAAAPPTLLAAPVSTKRKAPSSSSSGCSPVQEIPMLKSSLEAIKNNVKALTEVTQCLMTQMRRHNELLEEQNIIRLFVTPKDAVELVEATDLLREMRERYLKRVRVQAEL